MAIEITPKPKIRILISKIIFGGICVVLLVGFLASYFYFEIKIKKISQEIQEKDLIATPLENSIKEKEKELLPLEQKIADFAKLLSEHKKPLSIFEFFERICLPTVWFSSFDFTPGERKVIVSGKTDSFTTLEQQYLVLKQEPILKNINLSGISIDEEGGVNFSFLLTFDPQLFK
ncbi:hypothetical protein MUP50_00425 [Patescibacteria group bacterium]|nr:hypothetical protein [Patescibacteria group bacterium]